MSSSTQESLTPWQFAPITRCIPEDQYTDLEVIDLSLFSLVSGDAATAQAEAQKELIKRTLNAFNTTGFIALKGHGFTHEELEEQWALGKLLFENVSEEEKHRLLANIKEGSWAGYKPQGYHKRPDGSFDCVEHYDFYPNTMLERNLPEVAKPYVKDFRKFLEHQHYVVFRKLLAVLSLGMELDQDFLWKLHHRGTDMNDGALQGGPDEEINWKHGKDDLRYVMYHPPPEEDREKKKNLWVSGHTDFGSVTFLHSQPIAGLQVLMPNGQWRYIRHYPDHLIVSLGDSMEFLTGGVLKAAPHRVIEPPEDQRHLDRLALVYFFPFLPDVKLSLIDHPSLKKLGAKDVWEEYHKLGGKVLTSTDWIDRRSKLVGTKRLEREDKDAESVLDDIHFRHHPEYAKAAAVAA
ncbi:hypothetical protein D9758_003536 [Tetrapyrgos nigripes]|uniref:Clavaminate synthase-like protein n=1 Tax=Tetrapyrgos nigripes TaxID=182062 RepID=A0A8H5GVP4_9AGAR|nr:hypothetical protein D9758_003536 [Tetrapyrgos nigripes]